MGTTIATARLLASRHAARRAGAGRMVDFWATQSRHDMAPIAAPSGGRESDNMAGVRRRSTENLLGAENGQLEVVPRAVNAAPAAQHPRRKPWQEDAADVETPSVIRSCCRRMAFLMLVPSGGLVASAWLLLGQLLSIQRSVHPVVLSLLSWLVVCGATLNRLARWDLMLRHYSHFVSTCRKRVICKSIPEFRCVTLCAVAGILQPRWRTAPSSSGSRFC